MFDLKEKYNKTMSFDLVLFFLTFPDQQVFVIIISYRLGGLFGIFGRYNDLRELRVCKVCRRHAR